ncbi:MAG: (2Fe-2S) ferredoxin domain-containing protein [Candidatus Hydrogenedentes bacterium]|nr:(2Fe-2S) ferredoxin domain-containing protein [Candidatus Hydrogenedentota bacterium]
MSEKKSKKIKIEVCTGSHCAENKSGKIAKRMKEWIEEHGAGDTVCVKKCDCLKQCKKAAVVKVPSRDLTFEKVKPGDAARILKSILS